MNKEEMTAKIVAKMESNVKSQATANGLSEEEVEATWILNKKKVADDAIKLTDFYVSVFGEDSAQPELPVE